MKSIEISAQALFGVDNGDNKRYGLCHGTLARQ